MSRSRFRLARIRRLPLIAAFLFFVFCTRIGIGLACEPHELAELFGGADAPAWLATDEDRDDRSVTDHTADHCRQCQCHHGVALPNHTRSLIPGHAVQLARLVVAPHANAPPERHLRPPIV
ncbi:MAG TPA: hypothetical protein VN581_00520 [Patescibacteria group bacterium]|nr:hypothetical protein [Patescibacteria group bacterium]